MSNTMRVSKVIRTLPYFTSVCQTVKIGSSVGEVRGEGCKSRAAPG